MRKLLVGIVLALTFVLTSVVQAQTYQFRMTIRESQTRDGYIEIRGFGTAVCVGRARERWLFLTAGHSFQVRRAEGARVTLCQVKIGNRWVDARYIHAVINNVTDLALLTVTSNENLEWAPVMLNDPPIGTRATLQGFAYGTRFRSEQVQFVSHRYTDPVLVVNRPVAVGESGGAAYVDGRIAGIIVNNAGNHTILVSARNVCNYIACRIGGIPRCWCPSHPPQPPVIQPPPAPPVQPPPAPSPQPKVKPWAPEIEIIQGDKGDKGDKGDPGRGIESVNMDPKTGMLVVRFTDGKTQDVGVVPRGQAGKDGRDVPATVVSDLRRQIGEVKALVVNLQGSMSAEHEHKSLDDAISKINVKLAECLGFINNYKPPEVNTKGFVKKGDEVLMVEFAAGDEVGEEKRVVRLKVGDTLQIPAQSYRVRALDQNGNPVGTPEYDKAPLGMPLKFGAKRPLKVSQ